MPENVGKGHGGVSYGVQTDGTGRKRLHISCHQIKISYGDAILRDTRREGTMQLTFSVIRNLG